MMSLDFYKLYLFYFIAPSGHLKVFFNLKVENQNFKFIIKFAIRKNELESYLEDTICKTVKLLSF